MLVPVREEVLVSSPRIGSTSSVAWLYLLAEFLIGAAFSGFLALLGLVKSVLPQPPRDLTGDVALVSLERRYNKKKWHKKQKKISH